MEMTCMFQAHQHETSIPFLISFHWAYTYERCDELPYGLNGHRWRQMLLLDRKFVDGLPSWSHDTEGAVMSR